MKKFFTAAVLSVIAMGTIVLVVPTPVVNACVRCPYQRCAPCYMYTGLTCTRCGSCRLMPECPPR